MRQLYCLLLYLAGPLLWLGLAYKSRSTAAYRMRAPERFGHVPTIAGGVAVWVHAVSVGEVLTAAPMIRALLARYGAGQVYVTTGTPTGSDQVLALFGDSVRHSYAPYDLPHVVRRFVGRLQPRLVVVMETELWPNLFRILARRGVPLAIANARLSPRSVKGYGRVRRFAASVLNDVTVVAAQSEADAERFRQLGAPRVETLGNLKFDCEPDAAQAAEGRRLRGKWGQHPVWIAASTHEGEEAAALDAHRHLCAQWPDAVLILVPRHPSRFGAVAALIARAGFVCTRRSDGFPHSAPQVLLGDSMGEMWTYLALADLAFVGGSLIPVGGHNVLEPAAMGVPVLFGPHMHNFVPARDLLLDGGAAETVRDAEALAFALEHLFNRDDERRRRSQTAQAALMGSRGALARHLEILTQLQPPR